MCVGTLEDNTRYTQLELEVQWVMEGVSSFKVCAGVLHVVFDVRPPGCYLTRTSLLFARKDPASIVT